MSTEAVLLTAIINGMENRDVAILEVSGAFMQADMDEEVHVRFSSICWLTSMRICMVHV